VLAARSATTQAGSAESRSRQTILLFEEPELFIHPHLMRRLRDALRAISRRDDWQVIISTHSPFLVDVATNPCSLVIHRREGPTEPPTARQLQTDPFAGNDKEEERSRLRATLDFHPSVCEGFFARHVVLVEGDSEVAVLTQQPDLYRLADVDEEVRKDVSVVPCDGKWNIIPIARLLNEFGISVRAIHDMDRQGKADAELEEKKAHPYHANKRVAGILGGDAVHVVEDTLEDVLWEGEERPTSTKDKPYRVWKRVRDLCSEKPDLDDLPKLRELVQFAFRPFCESSRP